MKQIQCTICHGTAKSVLYVCESGHVICKNCEDCDIAMEDCNECGDYKPEKDFGPDNITKESQIKRLDNKTQDFASGDHDGANASTHGSNSEVTKRCKDSNTILINKEHCSTTSTETKIEFLNNNYHDCKSSVTAKIDNSINGDSNEEEIEGCKIVPRPVVCPVTNCAKMVTIDSIMLHFHFDHSKVPRIILDDHVPQEVTLKSTNITAEIHCIATFIIENHKRSSKTIKRRMDSISSIRNSSKDSRLLLLMAVRLPINPITLPNVKCGTSRIFTRSIYTQTEKPNGNDSVVSTECVSKSISDYKSCISKLGHFEDEVLLLWLCKLDDEEKVYSITLLGEDKKRGYCYIGDAIHVRDKQDPSALYDRSECLIVKGLAVNSLYDLEDQITTIVSIIG